MSTTAVLPTALPPAPPVDPLTLSASGFNIAKPKQPEALAEVERKAINAMDSFTCNICLDKFSTVGNKKPCSTSCGHTFCEECLMKGKLHKCPSCRSPLPMFNTLNKPTANFSLICVIENLGTKRELLPELQYSFAQKILIEELAKAQDLVRDLKLQLTSERLKAETKDKEISENLSMNVKTLEARVQEAEEKVLNKRLELSNVIGKTPNYLMVAKQNIAAKNPFTFQPQTFVPSSSFSAATCFNKETVHFDFASSNVPLVVKDEISNTQITLKKMYERTEKSNDEIDRAIKTTMQVMKDYEADFKKAMSTEEEAPKESVEGSVSLSQTAMNVVGTSEPIVFSTKSLRRKVKTTRKKKMYDGNQTVPNDVLATFEGNLVTPSVFEECISASCYNPISWIMELFSFDQEFKHLATIESQNMMIEGL